MDERFALIIAGVLALVFQHYVYKIKPLGNFPALVVDGAADLILALLVLFIASRITFVGVVIDTVLIYGFSDFLFRLLNTLRGGDGASGPQISSVSPNA